MDDHCYVTSEITATLTYMDNQGLSMATPDIPELANIAFLLCSVPGVWLGEEFERSCIGQKCNSHLLRIYLVMKTKIFSEKWPVILQISKK